MLLPPSSIFTCLYPSPAPSVSNTFMHMHSHTLLHTRGNMRHGVSKSPVCSQLRWRHIMYIGSHDFSQEQRNTSSKPKPIRADFQGSSRTMLWGIQPLSIDPFRYHKLQLAAGHWLTRVSIRSVGWADKASRVKHKRRSLTLAQHYETPMLQQQQPVFSQKWEVDWLILFTLSMWNVLPGHRSPPLTP